MTVQGQHAIVVASQMEIGHPGPLILHLSKIAARTLASEALFQGMHFMHNSDKLHEAPASQRDLSPSGSRPSPSLGDLF